VLAWEYPKRGKKHSTFSYMYFRKLNLFPSLGVSEEILLGLFQIKNNNKIPLINSDQSPVHANHDNWLRGFK
jgi:hypothetical protein